MAEAQTLADSHGSSAQFTLSRRGPRVSVAYNAITTETVHLTDALTENAELKSE